MERLEIPIEALRDAWVDAIERGDEVVLVRDGRVVAEVKPRAKAVDIEAIRARVPKSLQVEDAAALIRAMRDEERF